MNPSSAILVFDRDALFREALRNFLLAAGYAEVVIATTAREALAKLRCESYGHILIGIATAAFTRTATGGDSSQTAAQSKNFVPRGCGGSAFCQGCCIRIYH